MPVLSWRGLRKAYAGTAVVDNVSLDVEPGEILGLLGPSGSGKSTLLRLTAGLEAPDAGAVLLEGRDVTGEPPHARGVGLMFQDYCLFPHMSVAANVGFGLRMKRWPRDRARARVAEMLRLVRMDAQARRGVSSLSGGEQQRVALARSLAPRPGLLMLDEPLGALDALLRGELLAELRTILGQVGATALYVTHDRGEALALCTRIALMRDGRLEQVDAPGALVASPASSFSAAFLGLGLVVPAEARPQGEAWCARTALGDFRVPPPASVDSASSGSLPREWSLLVRPAAVRFADGPGLARMSARIEGYLVSGEGTSVRLSLAGAGAAAPGASLVIDCPLGGGASVGAVGAVGEARPVWLSAGSCLLLPRERVG